MELFLVCCTLPCGEFLFGDTQMLWIVLYSLDIYAAVVNVVGTLIDTMEE